MTTRFHSPFASDLYAFLAWKRALGCQYASQEGRLRSFDRIAAKDTAELGDISLERAVARWMHSGHGRNPSSNRVQLSIIRQFCLFLRRRDPQAYVPDRDVVPTWPSRCRPYLFSPDEIRHLLRETQTIRGPKAWLRRSTFKMLLLVYFCTGLRPIEAVRLRLRDLDTRRRLFFIRETKGRSRWVPFRSGLAREIRRYLKVRLAFSRALDSPFFLRPDGLGYTGRGVAGTFRCLCRRIGIKPRSGRVGPRLMDARHSFAVYRLTRWYEEGVDLHARLPWLSAYMGHENLLGTQTYLTAHPELLRIASRRFAARFRRKESL